MPEPLKPDEINELTKMLGDESVGAASASPAPVPTPSDPGKISLQSFDPPSGAPCCLVDHSMCLAMSKNCTWS